MRRWTAMGAMLLVAAGCSGVQETAQTDDGWIPLFDGQSLNGWRASENPATFRVENGVIVVHGPRAHLYYDGPVGNHDFRNFEWKAEILTFPQANSGMYFHTEFQETGWPTKGYEVQVNNSHSDPRRTGSLYAIDDVNEMLVPDGEWFTQHVIVEGKRVRILVNERQVVDYTEPASTDRPNDMAGRVVSSGTVALQGHDPNSQVHYRNIMIRLLPE